MSASSSTSLPIPADWLLPLMQCPFCGDEMETNVARVGSQAGQRFYKCIRYDARQCRFFKFQRAYCRRMTPRVIANARQQAGWHPAGQAFAGHQGNGAAQIVPAANQLQAQAQIQPQAQLPPPAANNLIHQASLPAAAGVASGSHTLGVVAVILALINIMLTGIVLLVVLATAN